MVPLTCSRESDLPLRVTLGPHSATTN